MNSRDYIDLTGHNDGLLDDFLTLLERNQPMRDLGASADEPTMMRIRVLRKRLHEGNGPVVKWDDSCPCSHCNPSIVSPTGPTDE